MVPSSARRAGETSLTMIVVVVAVLLMAAALATILALVQYLNAMQRPPALADFFPIERNESGEYRFTRPQSFILVPPAPDAGGVLSLRTRSPEPLPVRTLAIRLDERVQFTLAATAVPRRLMLLLPPSSSGRLLTLDVPPAQAPNDLRRLGVMIDSVTLRLLQQPWMWHAGLMVLAPVVGCAILAVTRCGWITMACGTLVIAGSALWGPVVPWMLVTVLGAARTIDQVAWRGAGADWLRQADIAICRAATPALLTIGVAATWAGVVGWFSLALHARYATATYDLGLFDQWLWLISRGRPAYSTGAGVHALGDHTSLLLYPLAALYLVAPDVDMLLLVQSMAISIGGIILYQIGSARGAPWFGILIAVAYLMHPATHNMALFHFHPDALAATTLLVAMLGVEKRDWRLIAAGAIATCAAKENFALTIAWLGVWLWLRGDKRLGSALFLGAIVWFGMAAFLIQPALNGQSQSVFVGRFATYGATPLDIGLTMARRPDLLIADILTARNVQYFWLVLAPFGMLPLFSPWRAALALPALALNALSSFDAQQELVYHYNALPVALLAVSGLDAAITLRRRLPSRQWVSVLCVVYVALGTATALNATPLRIQQALRESAHNAEQVLARNYILARIPPGAPVAASNALQPHLTHRSQAFAFPNPFVRINYVNPDGAPLPPRVDYIVHDTYGMGASGANRDQELLRELERRGLYAIVVRIGTVVLLQRTNASLPESCFGEGWQAAICHAPK